MDTPYAHTVFRSPQWPPSWAGDDEEPVPASFPSSQHRIRGRRIAARTGELPPDIEAAIWRGNQLGSPVISVVASGFAALDAELPGAGWPCHSLTEILQAQPTVAEWRLLAPAMRQVVASGGNIVVVGPPKSPHLPGLKYAGLDERHLVWIQADAPAERLWVTEQLIKTNAAGLLVSWLPQARHGAQRAVGLHPVPGLAQSLRQVAPARVRVVGNQLADEDEVLIGDHAVTVAQRLVHAPHGSSHRDGTQGGEAANSSRPLRGNLRCHDTQISSC